VDTPTPVQRESKHSPHPNGFNVTFEKDTKPKFEVMDITPDMAKKILAHRNKNNRPIRYTHLEKLSEAIEKGEWKVTHQGLAFDKDGNLIDGQHRLAAVLQTRQTVKMTVATNMDASIFDVVDTGSKRSTGDALDILGSEHGRVVSAALKVWICYQKFPERTWSGANIQQPSTTDITSIYKGLAKTLDSPVPPSLWGHNNKIKLPEYNTQKAIALLKEAGFEKGLKLQLWTLPISRPYNPNGKKMGELMQSDLKKVGIHAQLITYDWPSYLAKSSKGEHDLIQLGWSADIPDPSNFLQILLTCDSIPSGSNLSQWCNKDFDQLISKAMLQSQQKKAEILYKKAQFVFAQDIPLIPIAYAYKYTALSKKVRGYYSKPFGSERFYHLSLSKNDFLCSSF